MCSFFFFYFLLFFLSPVNVFMMWVPTPLPNTTLCMHVLRCHFLSSESTRTPPSCHNCSTFLMQHILTVSTHSFSALFTHYGLKHLHTPLGASPPLGILCAAALTLQLHRVHDHGWSAALLSLQLAHTHFRHFRVEDHLHKHACCWTGRNWETHTDKWHI